MSILDNDIQESVYLIDSYQSVLNTIDLTVSAINNKISFYRYNNTITNWITDLSTGTLISNNLIVTNSDTEYRGWIADRVRYLNTTIGGPSSAYIITVSDGLFNRDIYSGNLDGWQIGVTALPPATGYRFVEDTSYYASVTENLSAKDYNGDIYSLDVTPFLARAQTFEFVNHYLWETPDDIPESEKNKRGCRGLNYQLTTYQQSVVYQNNEVSFNREKENKLSLLQ